MITNEKTKPMTNQEVWEYLGISMPTLMRWKKNPLCPMPKPIGWPRNARPVKYRRTEIEAFKKTSWFDQD